ncbi:urate oxidase [Pseudonocardia thermophila]|jgi:urate oxidase|uniref:Uricase n=1 Tax=Pseudonocardia thermophila TaxID=1848 RepID=A0A1M6NSZ0_PSETH|nr:urate oxidase [Pseudonocardia thermophila]SHJ98755.1 urate oxidase [Pseudonocardia thermophila]
MGIVLGANQYGKAENRLVRIYRETSRHEIRDVTITTALRGDFADAHLVGDQANVLPTDTQKNTCYAFAKERGLHEIEDFGLALARHFVEDVEPVRAATITIDELGWQRAQDHDHTWVRTGPEVRTTEVVVDAAGEVVTSGVKDLVILKSTGSEFAGFLKDRYTTLEETHDRIMATSLVARWRYTSTDVEWDKTRTDVRRILIDRFADVHSLALQQTLWEMGKAVLEAHTSIAEISLQAPNKHHFLVDLSPFGLENPGEVFYAADRPYGLIEATVTRD